MAGWPSWFVIGVLVGVLSTGHVLAEPVAVRSGPSQGQGWVFAEDGRCWVATAAHVVHSSDAAIVSGDTGRTAQSVRVWRDREHDLAILEVQGALATACPTSTLGDADSRAAISTALRRGTTVLLLRRDATVHGGGIAPTPLDVIGLEDVRPHFTVSPSRSERDPLVQSDSGAPIVLQGAGVAEAGLPLGLAFELEAFGADTFVRVLFMDRVRALYERIRSDRLTLVGLRDRSTGTLLSFVGRTQSTACGPINILTLGAACGWQVAKSGLDPISVSVELEDFVADAGQITLNFAPEFAAGGIAVATRARAAADWSSEVYCSNASRSSVAICRISTRNVRQIRLTFEGDEIELVSFSVD